MDTCWKLKYFGQGLVQVGNLVKISKNCQICLTQRITHSFLHVLTHVAFQDGSRGNYLLNYHPCLIFVIYLGHVHAGGVQTVNNLTMMLRSDMIVELLVMVMVMVMGHVHNRAMMIMPTTVGMMMIQSRHLAENHSIPEQDDQLLCWTHLHQHHDHDFCDRHDNHDDGKYDNDDMFMVFKTKLLKQCRLICFEPHMLLMVIKSTK